MRSKLGLDAGLVRSCRAAAARVAAQVAEATAGRTTVAVERTVARMLGVDGVDPHDVPLPNALVDHVADFDGLAARRRGVGRQRDGADRPLGARGGRRRRRRLAVARRPAVGRARGRRARGRRRARGDAGGDAGALRRSATRCASELGEQPQPHRYVLTATGNVYEDRDPRARRRGGRRGHHRRDPLDRAEPARLRALRTDDRGLRRHVRDAGELPHHARGARRVVARARALRAPVELLLGPLHAGDRGDGRGRGARQHGQRRALRDPLPRPQHRCAR